MMQWNVAVARLRIVEHHVPVAKGTALDILAGHADRRPFGKNRCEGQRLGMSPVDRTVFSERSMAPLEHALKLRVHREALRSGQERLIQLDQPLRRHRRLWLSL